MDYFQEFCLPGVLFNLRFANVGLYNSTTEIWSRVVMQSVKAGDAHFDCESMAVWPSVADPKVLENVIFCIWQLNSHNVEARVDASPPYKFAFRYTNNGNTVISHAPETFTAHIRTLMSARLPGKCNSQEAEGLLYPIDSPVFMDRA
jgi:hypothetical protein